jgi:hypothetical protein
MHELLAVLIPPEGMTALLTLMLSHRWVNSLLLGFEVMTMAYATEQFPI